jgi:Secretion system C-terminal sorting domain
MGKVKLFIEIGNCFPPSPSPTSDFIRLESEVTGDYVVVNLVGQVVKTGRIGELIDVSGLSKGVYILKIDGGVRRFVVE